MSNEFFQSFKEETERKVSSLFERILRENEEGWREWARKIPALTFSEEWEVAVIPPFAGAMARFTVRKKGAATDDWVSVYLDVHDALGVVGQPYWEVFEVDGTTARCLMDETDELMKLIRKGVEQLKE